MNGFIKEFCLCKENEWVAENPKRAGKISADNLRKLRNSLTHFLSVEKIGPVLLYDDEIQKITNKTNHKVQFLSPKDFKEILSSAARLLIRDWSDDCKKCVGSGSNEFIDRMSCVKNVIEKKWRSFFKENNNIKKHGN